MCDEFSDWDVEAQNFLGLWLGFGFVLPEGASKTALAGPKLGSFFARR